MVEKIETKEAFDELIKKNTLVVIDFHATWCGPCKMISPKFEEFSGTYKGVTFAKVDVDDVAEVASACGISAMPTFQFYKNGTMVCQIQGANATKLEDELKKLIAGQ